jgi:esterase/lipase
MASIITKFEYFVRAVKTMEDRAKEQMEKFADNLNHNPLHAVEWGDSMVKSAAVLDVLKHVKRMIADVQEDGLTSDNARIVFDEIQRNVNSLAKYCAPNSTSAMSNLAKLYTLQAYAELNEYGN